MTADKIKNHIQPSAVCAVDNQRPRDVIGVTAPIAFDCNMILAVTAFSQFLFLFSNCKRSNNGLPL